MALTVGYVGSSTVHLAHNIEDNDQVPATLVHFDPALDSFVFPIPAKGQAIQRINPNFGSIASTDWNAHSNYHALQVNLVERPIRGLTYQVAYTWSKSIDTGSSTFSEGGENVNGVAQAWAFCQSCSMRGVSDFDVPHNFVVNSLYDLPVPAGVKAHALTNTLLGGWQVGGIYTRQSGGPFTLKLGSDQAFTGNSKAPSTSGGLRPQFVNVP